MENVDTVERKLIWWNKRSVKCQDLTPVLLLVFFLCGCAQKQYKEIRQGMGTLIEITVRAEEKEAKSAIEKAFKRIEEIEKILSVYNPSSEVSILNRVGKISPSTELMEVMKEAIYAGDMTEGAFDVTVAPVVSLWGFGPPARNPGIPQEKEIKRALELVGYKNIVIDEKNNLIYFKKKGMQINLGGIAKGYAVDKAIEVLKKEGIKKAIVNAGGNLYAMGTTWRIGIKNPRREGILKIINVKDRAVSTSGDYERFFIGFYAGKKKRFSHIFDPRTGYPAEGCISVTVIAPTGIMSDWLSTGVFVLGPEKGLALLKKLKIKGIIVRPDMEILEVK